MIIPIHRIQYLTIELPHYLLPPSPPSLPPSLPPPQIPEGSAGLHLLGRICQRTNRPPARKALFLCPFLPPSLPPSLPL